VVSFPPISPPKPYTRLSPPHPRYMPRPCYSSLYFSYKGSVGFNRISKKSMAQKSYEPWCIDKGNTTLRPSITVYQSKRRNVSEDEFPSIL
jgi:hypothetical protein